ncbi:MAG: putative lipid II flippase FtsW [Firmicutes bacterium]|nr:putative lipid II flippase FtsW [Bacillota bacterium]
MKTKNLKTKKLKTIDQTTKSGKPDIVLYVVALALTAFGVLMVYSASMYNAEVNFGNRYFFMFKQLLGAIFGIFAMMALTFMDYRLLSKFRYPILGVGFLLLILVFIPGVGVENYGARRWINLPFFTIQASEIAKFSFIIFTASYMAKNYKKMNTFKGVLPVLLVGVIVCVLIILEPNMSITMVTGLLMFAMLFMGGMRIKHLIIIIIPFAVLIPVLIIIEPYRLLRLMAFINPWESPKGEGYQLIQSFYSLGSGGLFGLGLFNSRQKYLFLPFSESDFILSIIGEEFGLFGCLVLFAGYVILIARAMKIAQNSTDRLGCYLASGIAALIAIQTLVNIAVVTGSIPPTGLPLPFISSGSSSLIVFLSSIGILQSVARNSHKSVQSLQTARKKKKEKKPKKEKAAA